MRFRDAEPPRKADMLEARERRGTVAARIAGNQHVVGVRFDDARGDRADAYFGNELHADSRRRVRVLEIVNQLREILDRVDVVVRGRTDEPDTRRGMANPSDVLVDFAPR